PLRPLSTNTSLFTYTTLFRSFQGAKTPSSMLKLSSGIINSSSTVKREPKPSQLGQAPNGALKEKSLGSNSSMEKSQNGQAKCSLKYISSSPITSITT